jgi:hypothetical protein
MAMKPIVKMASQNAAANSARASDAKKLALQQNGTFSPAVKPNMPTTPVAQIRPSQPPIGRRPTMEEMNPVMKPPVGIGMPPPSMGGGKPPFIPGEGGRGLSPPRTGGMIATPPIGMGGRLGAVGGAPAMGGSQMGGQLGAPGGMPAMGGMQAPVGMQNALQEAATRINAGAPALGKMGGMGMKKGGSVKASKMGAVKQSKPSMGSASKRGDGIAQRGKTKGRMV